MLFKGIERAPVLLYLTPKAGSSATHSANYDPQPPAVYLRLLQSAGAWGVIIFPGLKTLGYIGTALTEPGNRVIIHASSAYSNDAVPMALRHPRRQRCYQDIEPMAFSVTIDSMKSERSELILALASIYYLLYTIYQQTELSEPIRAPALPAIALA